LYKFHNNIGFISFLKSDIRESEVFIFEYTGEWTNDNTYVPKSLEQFVRFVDRSIYHQRKLDPTRLGLVVHDRLVKNLVIDMKVSLISTSNYTKTQS